MAQNWFLIVVALVIIGLTLITSLYILVNYMHPDDKNQAWFPKIVVVCGLTLTMLTVLAFPLDIGNTRACDDNEVLSACDFTLPMDIVWFILFCVNCAFVFAVIPFTLFYYECDEDTPFAKRASIGFVWGAGFLTIFGLVVGIIYGVAGFVEYETTLVRSGALSFKDIPASVTSLAQYLNETQGCMSEDTIPGSNQLDAFVSDTQGCNAVDGDGLDTDVWEVRTSFPVYIIAAASIIGWITFIMFGSFGMVALPVDLIRDFFNRPSKTITKSEYLKRAQQLGKDASKIKDIASELKQQERAGGRTKKWRTQMKALTKQMLTLEEEERELLNVFPQGEDRDTRWGLYMISFYFKFFAGVVFFFVAIAWVVHIAVYMILARPVHTMLNAAFKELDDVFPLFGVLLFTIFCSYLILATIKGHIKLGVGPITLFNAYPMRVNGTLMSAFLVNVALMMLSSMAVVQFCAQAFEAYASNTAVGDIFGQQISNLRGVKYLFTYNIFIIIFLCLSLLGTLFYCVTGKKKKGSDKYADRMSD